MRLLLLGYFAIHGDPQVTIIPDTTWCSGSGPIFSGRTPTDRRPVAPAPARRTLLSRTGADVLLRNALPMDHQVDGLMLTLVELRRLRLHMLPHSLVDQCMDHADRDGSWHTHTVAGGPPWTLLFTAADGTPRSRWVLRLAVLAALFTAAVVLWVLLRAAGRHGHHIRHEPL